MSLPGDEPPLVGLKLACRVFLELVRHAVEARPQVVGTDWLHWVAAARARTVQLVQWQQAIRQDVPGAGDDPGVDGVTWAERLSAIADPLPLACDPLVLMSSASMGQCLEGVAAIAQANPEPTLGGCLYGALQRWQVRTQRGSLRLVRAVRAAGEGSHATPTAMARWLALRLVAALEQHGCAGWPRTIDPAAGGGALLVAAFEVICRHGAARDLRAPLLAFAGSDCDPWAVMVARGSLWLAGRGAVSTRELAEQLRHGDALLGPSHDGTGHAAMVACGAIDWRFAPAYDAALLNPPYIESKRLPVAMRSQLNAAGYRSLHGLWDLAVPFLERALGLLSPNGVLAAVLPNKLAARDYAAFLRQRVLNDRLALLADVASGHRFRTASVYPLLALVTREPRPDATMLLVDERHERIVPRRLSSSLPRGIWPASAAFEAISCLLASCQERGARALGKNLGQRWYRPLGFRWTPLLSAVSDRPAVDARRLIGCRSVEPMRLVLERPLRLAGQTFTGGWLERPASCDRERWSALGQPQLLVREVARHLTAAVDERGETIHLTGIYGFGGLESEAEFSPLYCAALLNSSTLRWIAGALGHHARQRGGYLDIKGSLLELLPLLPATRQRSRRIETMARTLVGGPPTSLAAVWAELDAEVAELYGVDVRLHLG